MTHETFAHPVVSLIVEHPELTGHILLQRRSKEKEPPFRDLFELPQGRIQYGETLLDCAKRELAEETGLNVRSVKQTVAEQRVRGEALQSAEVLFVSQAGLRSYLAVCLKVSAIGVPHGSAESADPSWLSPDEIRILLSQDRVFPLNVPMLEWHLRGL